MITDSQSPRVTVLMAVYNGAAYLRQAIESILVQTFGDFEFLIVDDGSTDNSRAIIASYDDPRIRILDNAQNIGLTRALNRGLAQSRGELIARQDADDISYPRRLEMEVDFLNVEPQVIAVGSQAHYIDPRGRRISAYGWDKLQSDKGIRWQSMFDSPFVHTSVMFRRTLVWGIEHGYDETFETSQDFELWSRLLRRGQLRNLPEILVGLRQHSESVSVKKTEDKVARVRDVLRANLDLNVQAYPDMEIWLDLWIKLNNPRISGSRHDLPDALRHVVGIRDRYLKNNPNSESEPEINWHTAALLLRVAFAVAAAGQNGAVRLARGAARYDARLVLSAVPRLVGKLLRHFASPNAFPRH